MEELPIPLSRVELYLAKAAGMDVTPPEPKSRLELFLAKIAGMDVETPLPLSLKEQWLSCVYYGTTSDHPMLEGAYYIDNQKVDVRYLAVASGVPGATLPAEPQNRKEQYWAMIAIHGPIHGVLKYVTGTNITLTDVVSGIEELQFVYGDTYQQTYSGKNLFNSYALAGKTFYPASCQMNIGSDGTITLTGNTSSNGYCRVMNTPLRDFCPTLEVGRTYYLYLVGENLVRNIIYLNNSGSDWDAGTSRTITQSDLDGDIVFYGGYNTTTTIKIMVTKAQDNNYEPYVGGIPAPNPDYPQDVQVVTGEQTVEVSGKNLFDKNNVNQYMGYFEGDTDNPSLVYGSTGRNRVIYIKCKPSTTYSISLTTRDGINSPQVGTTDSLPVTGLAVTKLGIFASGSLKLENLTTSATAQYIVIRFQTNPSNVRFDDISQALLAGLQIEQGSTATAYEPYQGQSYEINLGKNLWGGFSADMTRSTANIDFNNLANGDIFVAAGTSSGQANSLSSSMVAGTDRLLTLEAGTYTISGATGFIRVQLVNNSGTTLASDTGNGATVTLTSKTQAFVRASFDGGQTVNDTTIHPQLEKGSTATSYAPYFTPIELCKIGDYQDYIYKSGDDWYVHKETGKAVFDGDQTETWKQSGAYNAVHNIQLADILPADNNNRPYQSKIYCDHFTLCGSGYNGGYLYPSQNGTTAVTSDKYLSFNYSQTTSIATWTTWLSSNNVSAYYPIATPTDTQITDATLVGQLDALNSAVLPKPIAHITVGATDSNLSAPIKISYYGRGA